MNTYDKYFSILNSITVIWLNKAISKMNEMTTNVELIVSFYKLASKNIKSQIVFN